jgi:hypothetical protein
MAVIILAMAAYAYRPLNAMERQLVGRWHLEGDTRQPRIVYTYHSDRTMLESQGDWDIPCRWSIHGNQLTRRPYHPPDRTWLLNLKWRYVELLSWNMNHPQTIQSISPSRVVIRDADGEEYVCVAANLP